MKSIIIITNNSKTLEIINDQCEMLGVSSLMYENQLNIETKSGRLYISLNNDIIEDYDEDELKIINHIFFGNQYYYLVCFSSILALHNLMSIISIEGNVYVDDDMGNIMPLSKFKESSILFAELK